MTSTSSPEHPVEVAEQRERPLRFGRRLGAALSPKNIGAVYVWVIVVVLFSLIAPDTFPTWATGKSILNQYAITGLMALSLIIPLAAGYYDLSIGFTAALSGVICGKLLLTTTMSPVLCILIVMCCCVGMGLLNALVVIGLGVDSFIGTLGTGAVFQAITLGISNGLTQTGGRIGGSFSNLAVTEIGGLQLPVFYLLAVMVVMGYVLERTKTGRFLYAMGFDRETARLTGISVNRIGIGSFVVSAMIAGFAGMVLTARVASSSPEAGPAYLIPAFSAAFLGATQLRGGKFNTWGTVIAVLLLGTGSVGLLLAGGPTWTASLFEGMVLIVAVALTVGRGGFREQLDILRARRAARRQAPVSG